MNAQPQPQPAPLKKSWISKHPYVVIGLILVGCLAPFLNRAMHTDDALFVWTGEWIQKHPGDFFGFQVNWWVSGLPMWVANWNPPLFSYFLAGVAFLFGWNEMGLHLACLAVSFAAAAGIYSLAKMWCERPLLATIVAVFTPAFLVSSTTLMCDVPMLAFGIWALVFWERALAKRGRWWSFILAGGLAGLAVLTKYSAVILLPLLPILSILRARKAGWWLLGLVVPLAMITGYELLTVKMYGEGLFTAAEHYARMHRYSFPGGWKARGIVSLTFTGGSLLPLMLFAPFLWRWRTLLIGGVVIFGVLLGMLQFGGNWGLNENPELLYNWSFLLPILILMAGGIHFLLLTASEAWRRRDKTTIKLVLWIVGGIVFATTLNWTVNAKGFLLIVPPSAILLVRRLSMRRDNSISDFWYLLPMVPTVAVVLEVAIADYQLANSARTAARQIAEKYKPSNQKMWFEGHWGFQYYMEKLGGQSIDIERSRLEPGDIVVVPWINYGFVSLPVGRVGRVDCFGI